MRSPRSTLALLSLLATANASAAPAAAEVGALPVPVKEYVAGWVAHDGTRVDKVVDEDGGYRDPALFAPISGPDLADYVDGFRGAKVELLEARKVDAEHLDLSWRITWPDARGTIQSVDHLTVAPDRIKIVVSEGQEIPPTLWPVIRAYFDHRGRAEAGKTAALFGPDGVLEAKNLPKGGIAGERLEKYFEGDAIRTITMRPGGVRQMTKDGRPAVDFELKNKDGSGMVNGREVFTIAEGHIRRLHGLF